MKNILAYLNVVSMSIPKYKLSRVIWCAWIVFVCGGVTNTSFAHVRNVVYKVTELGFSLQAKPIESKYGEKVTLYAKVDGHQPTGKVIFYNGNQQLGEFKLAVEHNGVATLEVTPMLEVGEHRLKAHYLSDHHRASEDNAEVLVKVSRGEKEISITGFANDTCIYGQACAVSATSSNPNVTMHFFSQTPDVCLVDETSGQINARAIGTCNIVARQEEDSRYSAAQADYSLMITAATLDLPQLPDLTTTYGSDKTFQLNPPVSPSQGEFSYHIAENEQMTATVNEKTGEVTINEGGIVTITVKQAAHGNYQAALGSFKLRIGPGEGGIKQDPGLGAMTLEPRD